MTAKTKPAAARSAGAPARKPRARKTPAAAAAKTAPVRGVDVVARSVPASGKRTLH